jgi:hypothetical protein
MRDSIRYLRLASSPVALCSSRTFRASLAIGTLMTPFLFAQTSVPPGSMPSSNHHQKPAAGAVQAAVPTPPPPDWPINSQPKAASVTWNKDALSINATNSSLQQILADVASATGASVDGITKDERIFGSFGPAPARDVIAQLLQGSGYNVLMVGDQGQGVPRQVILSERNTSKASQGATRSAPEQDDDDYAPEPQYDPPPQAQQPQPQPPSPQQFPMPARPGFNPANPGAITSPQVPGQQPNQPGQQPNPPNQ